MDHSFYMVIVPLTASHEDIRLESSITGAVMKRDEERSNPLSLCGVILLWLDVSVHAML